MKLQNFLSGVVGGALVCFGVGGVVSSAAAQDGDCVMPTVLGGTESEAFVFGVVTHGIVVGDLVYEVGYFPDLEPLPHGLMVYDFSDPSSIEIVESFSLGGRPVGVAIEGDVVYIADRLLGLRTLDLVNGGALTTLELPGVALSVAVSGSIAFVADGLGGLQVVDVSDPALLTIVGSYQADGFAAKNILVVDGRAYVTGGGDFWIFDVSDPSLPALVGTLVTPGYADGFDVAGDIAYIGDGYRGFMTVDVSDPSSPIVLGTLDVDQAVASEVSVVGTRAYVTGGSFGLVIDVSDLMNPSLMTFVRGSSVAVQATEQDRLYIIGQTKTTAYDVGGELGGDCPALCYADMNVDGSLNFFDISIYLNSWQRGDPIIDINMDGSFNAFDISGFLAAFAAGCP